MKKLAIVLLTTALSATALSTTALAGDGHRYKSPEARLEKMQQELSLSDEQVNAIRSLQQQHHEEIKNLRNQHRENINSILTAEQQQLWQEKMEQRRNGKKPQRHSH